MQRKESILNLHTVRPCLGAYQSDVFKFRITEENHLIVSELPAEVSRALNDRYKYY